MEGEREAVTGAQLVVPTVSDEVAAPVEGPDEVAAPVDRPREAVPTAPGPPASVDVVGDSGAAAEQPSDQATELNELIHTLLHALRRDAAERFGPAAATPGQQRLLRVLQRADGPRRLGELAQMLDVAPRSITAKVDQAEADGQVRRVPDPADRRATFVELTPAGRDVLARVSAERSVSAADRLARLTPDERAELIRLLRAVAAPPA